MTTNGTVATCYVNASNCLEKGKAWGGCSVPCAFTF
jgi:hypothetical protein